MHLMRVWVIISDTRICKHRPQVLEKLITVFYNLGSKSSFDIDTPESHNIIFGMNDSKYKTHIQV